MTITNGTGASDMSASRRVGGEHHRAREHDRQDRLEDEHEAVAEEEPDRLQVHGRPRHQLSRLLMVEEAELEALEVAVEPLAQVVLDPERDASGDHAAEIGQPPAH